MKTLRFDDDFLLKYGGLFQTHEMVKFINDEVDHIDEQLKEKYSRRITIYWYIHTDHKNRVLLARHLQIDVSSNKETNSFAKSFHYVFTKNFPHISSEEKENLNISYVVVEHEEENFRCVNPNDPKSKQKYVLEHRQFDIDMHFLGAFKQLEQSIFFGKLKNNAFFDWFKKNVMQIMSLFLALFMFSLLTRLISIPLDTIQFEALSYSLTDTLLYQLKEFVKILIATLGVFLMTLLVLRGFRISTRMKRKVHLWYELKAMLWVSLFFLAGMFLILALFNLLTNVPNEFSNRALESYLSDTQTPAYIEINYTDLNETKTEKILYLGESGQNVFFLPADDLHHLLYRDQKLTKLLCMAKPQASYMQSMLPMIYAQTFDNRVYYRTRAKPFEVRSKGLPFQETFCFNFYPKAVHLKSNQKDLLLMGKPGPEENERRFYYYELASVKSKLLDHKGICDVNNSIDLRKKMMRSEVLKDIPYEESELSSEDFEDFDLYQYLCVNPQVE